jgi:hypothetical protein
MASESSSPSTSSGQLPEMPPTLPYPHLNMPPIQDLGGPHMKRQRTESFSPENRGMISSQHLSSRSDNISVVTSSRNFDYHGTNWMASDASPSTTKPQTEVSQSFWRANPQDSPLTPAFSPFTPSLQIPPPQSWPPPQTEASPRDELAWSVPQRSISYSNLEGLQGQQHYAPFQHPPSQQVDHYTTKPRMVHSGMYPPPISTSGSAISAAETVSTTNEPSQHPHSAGSLPPTPYHSWQPSYSLQKPGGSSGEPYGSWNAPHGGQPHLLEAGAHGGQTGYAYGEPTSGMYYPPPPHAGR